MIKIKSIKIVKIMLIIWFSMTLWFFMTLPGLLKSQTVSADDIRVTIRSNKTNAIVGEQIQVVVSVEGTRDASDPEFPASEAYDIYFQGKSSRFEIINSRATSSLDFNYILIPRKKGEIRIPPVPVRTEGKKEYTQPLTLYVSDSPAQTKGPQAEDLLILTAEVDDTEAFVNQQIIYTLRFYRAVQIQGASLESLDFEGFRAEKLGKEREYNQVIKGKGYSVTELRYALFPQSSGAFTIPPAKLKCQVLYKKSRSRGFPFNSFFNDPFFGGYETKTEYLSTQPISIDVNPLPPPEDQDLDTPLVGEFTISAGLNPKNIKVGESSTLTISISGIGNIYSIPDPYIGDMTEFKTYEDKPQVDIKTTLDGISGTKVFKKALVPTKPGEYSIPSIKLPFLSPDTGRYKTASTKPISLTVLPGSEEETINLVAGQRPVIRKEEIKLLGTDILPPKKTITAINDQSVNLSAPLLLLLLILPPLAFSAVFLIEKKKRHIATDQAYYRRKNAQKVWKKELKIIRSSIESDVKRFYSQSSQSIKQFLGDRLNATGKALTPQEIDQRLREYNVPEELRDRLTGHLHTLEMGEFGALHQSPEDRNILMADIEKIISRLMRWI